MNQACSETCKAIRSAWAPIVEKPLAIFVLGTWAIQIIIVCAALYAISGASDGCGNEDDADSSAEDDAKSAVAIHSGIMVLFAIIHSCFAIYIQRRLVSKIEATEDDNTKLSTIVWDLLK